MQFSKRGFTLIELVVVMSLFMVILGVTVSMFISVIRQQKRVLAEQELLGQVQNATEYMAPALRKAQRDVSGSCLFDSNGRHTGFWYLLTHYNETTKLYEGIKLINEKGECQEFFFDATTKTLKISTNNQSSQDIISAGANLSSVTFVVNGDKSLYGVTSYEVVQPRVTVLMKAVIPVNGHSQEKSFQFTVSKQ